LINFLFLKLLEAETALQKAQSNSIISKLCLQEGDSIADIGAAGGYFSIEFAKIVGCHGKVLAVDRNSTFLEYINYKYTKHKIRNITTIFSENFPGSLLEQSIDMIFMKNVFHHLQNPHEYFSTIKPFIKSTGKIAIIDHIPGKPLNFVNIFNHVMPLSTIKKTMLAANYKLSESFDFLPTQSFTIWEQNKESLSFLR
jgi:ubiquinone/menaquinone biosynthesis C-methylase UbiE